MTDLKQKLELGEKTDYSIFENRVEDGLKEKKWVSNISFFI